MPPMVSRDGLFYNGNSLVAKPQGTQFAHHRCQATSLYDLLTYEPPHEPALIKKGDVAKGQPRPHKDEPGHFYIAQLALYGLKPYKTKDAAKKHLLAAFNGGRTLAVAPHIVQLECELKEEYEKAIKTVMDTPFTEKVARERTPREAIAQQKAAVDGGDDDFGTEIQEIRDDEAVGKDVAKLLSGLSSDQVVLLVTRLVNATPSLMDEIKAELMVIRGLRAPPQARARQTMRKDDPYAMNADAMLQVGVVLFEISLAP